MPKSTVGSERDRFLRVLLALAAGLTRGAAQGTVALSAVCTSIPLPATPLGIAVPRPDQWKAHGSNGANRGPFPPRPVLTRDHLQPLGGNALAG